MMFLSPSSGYRHVIQARCSVSHSAEAIALKLEVGTALAKWIFQEYLPLRDTHGQRQALYQGARSYSQAVQRPRSSHPHTGLPLGTRRCSRALTSNYAMSSSNSATATKPANTSTCITHFGPTASRFASAWVARFTLRLPAHTRFCRSTSLAR